MRSAPHSPRRPATTWLTSRPRSVKITTTVANHVLEGTVFAADPVLNAIAINTAPAPPNPSTSLATQPGNYHVVSIPNIQKFELLSSSGGGGQDGGAADGPGGFESITPTIASLDLSALKAREEAAVRKLLEKEEHRNKEVTSEVQELYDAFNRTYVPPPPSFSPGTPLLAGSTGSPSFRFR